MKPHVVVIGGGIVGACIAFELARHRVADITLVERAPGPGEGSTGASSSICRTRYSHPQVVRLAVDGLRAYRAWSEYLERPVDAHFVETGALWLAELQGVPAELERLESAGATAEILDATDLVSRFPALSACAGQVDDDHECADGSAFMFEPRAGYIDPMLALTDVLAAAAAVGVDVLYSAPVTDLVVRGAAVTGVEVAGHGRFDADVVVNAAGPWCNRINDMAGVEHRWTFTPTRIQTVYVPWPEHLGPLPITIDLFTGVYARPELHSGMVWVGSVAESDEREAVADPDSLARTPSPPFRDKVLALLQHRIPSFSASGSAGGVAGLYTINTQDVHPVVGPSGVDGLWLANGFSGHGFKLAPMIGSMVARALGGPAMSFDTEVPMSLFDIARDPIQVESKSVLA
ncbi:MAG: FAD-binding oxidoreductase [Acidimicrobiia bacterium]|nr:FAD-binding oxidoreductase [Acidimicrobiia bacterium]